MATKLYLCSIKTKESFIQVFTNHMITKDQSGQCIWWCKTLYWQKLAEPVSARQV